MIRRARRSRDVHVISAALALTGAAALCGALAALPVGGQPIPAGDTAAVLSFIDAADGYVEVVRHWPQAPVDVEVYPFVPYFWGGCPGPGAVMMLVTAPPVPPGAIAAWGTEHERLQILGAHLAAGVTTAWGAQEGGIDELRQLASRLRTPGDPIVEALKVLLPLVADLGSYERRGYAVFAFTVWQGWRCGVTLRAVPEGYGIPLVR